VDFKEAPKIGKYDVIGVIGRSGNGIVYKATDRDLGRVVAIKVMISRYSDDPDLLNSSFTRRCPARGCNIPTSSRSMSLGISTEIRTS
jgi:serine/threonine protein kinase